MLRLINRLIAADNGSVSLFGKDIRETSPTALRRQIGYVLQRPGLFPHWTVQKNIGLVPRLLGWPKDKIKERVVEMLDLVNMPADTFAKRYPSELSGGQQQRIGIARALAANPELVFYDEPFSALDPITRRELQQEVLRLKASLKKTGIFVTHDIREAFLLGDKVLIMQQGRKVQWGTPEEIRANPANEYVEQFIQTSYDD